MGQILYAGAIHIREQSKIDAARITQKSGNERRGAESELNRFSASLSNRRAMDAAGKNINAITENIAVNLDAASFGNLQRRVKAAEDLGAASAMAGAAGIGGSSLETYNATMRLSQAMQGEQGDRAVDRDLRLTSESRGTVLTDTVAGLDNNVYVADQDFTQYVDHHKMGVFEQVASLALAAGATYFGGPQAGMAVLGLEESRQASRNGDFAGASNSLMGAIQNGVGGFKAFRAGAGQGEMGSPVMGRLWSSTRGIAPHDGPEPGTGPTIDLSGTYGDRRRAMGMTAFPSIFIH